MNDSPSKEILPLTGVRFLAVTMIFLFHYSYKFLFAGKFVTGILDQFFLGVQVFFVLSGFVICYKYYETASLTKNFLSTYYLRRFAKIYPSFFILTTLSFAFWYFKSDLSSFWKLYILNITFAKGLSANYYLTGIGPTWSLTVEEMFYLLSPFIFLFIKRKNILFPQVFFSWTIAGLLVLLFTAFPWNGFFANAPFVFFVTFFGRCFEFYIGIFLALYILRKFKTGRTLPSFSIPGYTIVGGIAMAVATVCIYVVTIVYRTSASETLIGLCLTNIIFPLATGCFFYGLIREQTIVQRFFSTQLLQLLGKSSYAFFLLHTGVIATGVEKYISKNIFVLFIVLQGLSILMFKLFESPINKWIRRKGQGFSGENATVKVKSKN